ncbi:DNA segregation ATPase FtsK/SpoIIIE, S-DNA-T family [Oribacterium sp. KHPX15]|uniref:FtsK/SpoIIIE family DNA translocase n=1 Tax=Oribacterium sp. KHPX15 TaxID=1855342 RepID=UPI0008947CFE|nr:DNA translocase FtsK [Oribacterium sp. KHPX15]SDZ87263.1 DNA segregation ATPase FtsK/SpoIIIE, S-DNA-T family [Oribacterium sp. KHPX15]
MGRPKGSKNKAKKRTTTSSRSKKTTYDAPMMSDEVAIIITFAISAFLFLSNLGLCGPIGAFLRGVQLGLFGIVGFIFPIVLSFVVVFILSNLDNPYATFRMTTALFMLIFISAFLQLAFGEVAQMGLADFYKLGAEKGTGGGAIGGALAMVLYSVTGKVGAILILLVACFICLIYITGKPLARILAEGSGKAAIMARDRAKENWNDVATSARIRREERRLAREAQQRELAQKRIDFALTGTDDSPAVALGSPTNVINHTGMQVEEPLALASNNAAPVHNYDFDIAPSRDANHVSEPDLYAEPFAEVDAALDAAFERHAKPESKASSLSSQGTDAGTSSYRDNLFNDVRVPHSAVEPSTGIEVTEVTDELYDESSSFARDTNDYSQFSDIDNTAEAAYEDNVSENDISSFDNMDEKDPQENFLDDDGISMSSDGKATISRGDMEQGRRRIVTSNGQIIDADVEPVSKKIETQLEREKRENTPTALDNAKVEQEIKKKKPPKPYIIPPLSLLKSGGAQDSDSREEIRQNAVVLQETLKSFGINVKITNISVGPAVTRYELQPEIGVKVSKIVSLTNDIKMALAAVDIRIEAPIPGKSAVGIEVPNKHSSMVYLGDVFRSQEFMDAKSRIAFGVGKDIAGKTIVTDIAKMPHLLIAGSTGSGKSVCINTLIMSMLFKYKPEELRMIMVDPKVVELSVYNGIPHLLIPVVTDPKKAAAALNWAVAEMTDRYKKFAESGSRDLKGYNEKIERVINDPEVPEDQKPEKLPQIVIIIDELADLMMVSSQEVEDSICRIAQLARAAGMHLVIATQRPTVDVITGLIKANVPSRIAFAVSSGTDSRTIIDMNGAEKLLGKGDMLFFPQGIPKPVRVQGAFVSDQEVGAVTDFIKKTMGDIQYSEDIQAQVQSGGGAAGAGSSQSDLDDLFFEAGQLIIESEKASIGMLQRKFRIGFNRAARIMDQLAEANVVGPEEGTKPRKILMSLDEFNALNS